jgi:hypothetical protein
MILGHGLARNGDQCRRVTNAVISFRFPRIDGYFFDKLSF